MTVDAQALFLTSAEISVAFAGFASLVGVFLMRSEGALPLRIRSALWSMLEYALLALFACLVPLVIMLGGSVESSVWAISSGIVAFGDVLYVFGSQVAYREVIRGEEGKSNAAVWILLAGDAVMTLVLVANGVGWPFETSLQVFYTAGVAWKILGAALSFRELVRMAWSGRA